MYRVQFRTLSALISLMIGLLPATAAAQVERVRLSGRVRDATGADVPNVCVTLQVTGSTNVSAIRTDNEGGFVFEAAPSPTYDLSFKAEGFLSRTLTVKADGSVVAVPPIVLQLSLYHPYFEPLGIEEAMERQAKVHSEGTLEVRENCMIDLDSGKAICPPRNIEVRANSLTKHDDIRIQRDNDGLYFVPTHGAAIAKGNSNSAALLNCSSASYSKRRMHIDDLPEGSSVCVQTNEGHQADLWLWFKEPVCANGDIWISFVTWKRKPRKGQFVGGRRGLRKLTATGRLQGNPTLSFSGNAIHPQPNAAIGQSTTRVLHGPGAWLTKAS